MNFDNLQAAIKVISEKQISKNEKQLRCLELLSKDKTDIKYQLDFGDLQYSKVISTAVDFLSKLGIKTDHTVNVLFSKDTSYYHFGYMVLNTEFTIIEFIHEFGHHLEYQDDSYLESVIKHIHGRYHVPKTAELVTKVLIPRSSIDKFCDEYMEHVYYDGGAIVASEFTSRCLEMIFDDVIEFINTDAKSFKFIYNELLSA